MGKIIAFANQKGGVGKTTTCINVAAYMAAMGKNVLIVDMDPQGNATSGVGIDKSSKLKTLYNVITKESYVEEVILNTKITGLDIIPSTVDLAGAEIDLVQMNSKHVVKNSLDKLKVKYDFILIDCPPSLGMLTVNALTSADSVIIPIQCEFFALEGLTQLMNTIRLIIHHLNPELKIEGVVLTMKDNRSNLVAQVSEDVRKFFNTKVYDTYIPRNIRLAEAPSHGMPILLYDTSSKGANAYQSLTEEILNRNKTSYKKIIKNTKINLRGEK